MGGGIKCPDYTLMFIHKMNLTCKIGVANVMYSVTPTSQMSQITSIAQL